MTIRKLLLEEYAAFGKIQAVAFSFSQDFSIPPKEPPKVDPNEDIWGAFNESNKLMACIVVSHFTTRIGTAVYKMAGIGGVACLPEFRRTGAIRAIFEAIFDDIDQQGFALSGLYPFSHAFYRKFGYELAHAANHWIVPLKELAGLEQPFDAVMDEGAFPSDALLPDLKAVHAAFSAGLSLSVPRERDVLVTRNWHGDAYKDRSYRYVLYNEEKAPIAYVCFKPIDRTDNAPRMMDIRELAYVDKDAFFRLLGFLYRFYPHYQKAKMMLPTSVQLNAVLPNPYELEHKPNNSYMMRVTNVALLLQSYPCPCGDGILSIQLHDAFRPKNSGVYTISWANGVLKTQKASTGKADVTMDVTTFAQMACGFLSPEQAFMRRDVTFASKEAARLLGVLFPVRAQYIGLYY